MKQIRPWLYIGKYQDTLNRQLLTLLDIKAILQLAGRVEQPSIDSMYLPVADGQALDFARLKKGLAFILTKKAAEQNILVACGAGISRSSSFALAALKEVESLRLTEALKAIRKYHPEARPHPALWISLGEYYQEAVSYRDLM